MSTVTEVLVATQKIIGEFAKAAERNRDSCESEEIYQFYEGQLVAFNRISEMLCKAARGYPTALPFIRFSECRK